jgi:Cu/Ag efflux pump CusA
VRVGDVADVVLGPDIRRGVAELDGKGEVVGACRSVGSRSPSACSSTPLS